jgi:hypothetical protein
MFEPATTRIHPLTEAVIDEIVLAAGGVRAHPDHHKLGDKNADYRLGSALVELKILEDDGFGRNERHEKLAALFSARLPGRPVYVLDPQLLTEQGQRDYERAVATPIKNAIKTASGQLYRSRQHFPNTDLSILMIVNSGNAALDHDEILRIAVHRVRNDTDKIDGVIVAGAYLHSDGFEANALWPMSYEPVRLAKDFSEFEDLRTAFHDYAERAMTRLVQELPTPAMTKGPVIDSSFDVGGRTFVKPAPPFGRPSDFYVNGRPRLNAGDGFPPVATIYPELTRADWEKVTALLPDEPRLGLSYEAWLHRREQALAEGRPNKPVVAVSVSLETLADGPKCPSFEAIGALATDRFQRHAIALLEQLREMDSSPVLASRFVLAITEEIGQDERNDVSHVVLVDQASREKPRTKALAENLRVPHMHACALAAAYAIKHGVGTIYWSKDRTYAWA